MSGQGPMTEAMYYILLALLRPGHGYGMMQRIRELSSGRINMGPGTLYGVLTRMQKDGWIVLVTEEDRRKNYAITDEGRRALIAEYGRIKCMLADGKMLEDGATTFYETEEGWPAFERAGSLCHGWSAMPVHYYHLLKVGH